MSVHIALLTKARLKTRLRIRKFDLGDFRLLLIKVLIPIK